MLKEIRITPQSQQYSLPRGLSNKPVDVGAFLIHDNMGKKERVGSRLYWVYFAMKDRCVNPKSKQYADYGGRGISVCDEWLNDNESFFTWAILAGYKQGLQLNRKDNDKGYLPENCEFTTRILNNSNKRIYKRNHFGLRGVEYRCADLYRCRVRVNCKIHNVGHYKTKEDCALAYNNFIITNNINRQLNEI